MIGKHIKGMIARIPLWVLIALLGIVSAVGVYAAYTSIQSVKRVVSTMPSPDELFSSNYLEFYEEQRLMVPNSYQTTKIQFHKDSEKDQIVYLSVCNYAQGCLTSWSDRDIKYDIVFTIVEPGDGVNNAVAVTDDAEYEGVTDSGIPETVRGSDILASTEYKVTVDGNEYGFTDGKCTISAQTLARNNANKNVYAIKLDRRYTDYVNICAEVKTVSGTKAFADAGLAGILGTAYYSNGVMAGWTGRFIDDMTMDSKKVSGFNYQITGIGEGEYTIAWDKRYIDINPRFLKDIEEYTVSYVSGASSGELKFEVGESGEAENFRIQFYRVCPPVAEENWTMVGNYITNSVFEERTE